MFVRLAKGGGPFVYTPEFVAEYRVHADSATAQGLWVDRLATKLIGVEVTARIEPHKLQLLSALVPSGVSRALSRGDRSTARALLHSRYYSVEVAGLHRLLAHRALALLPGRAAASLIALIRR